MKFCFLHKRSLRQLGGRAGVPSSIRHCRAECCRILRSVAHWRSSRLHPALRAAGYVARSNPSYCTHKQNTASRRFASMLYPGGEGGIRLFCGKAGPALTVHRTVIHSRPVRIPLSELKQQKRHSIKSTFFVGGEGGIRTLERFYTLHDFQSCALDQARRLLHRVGLRQRVVL